MHECAGRRPSEWKRASPTIAVSIAPANSTEVRRYGIIGGSLDAVDKLVKKLSQPGLELRVVYEAGPCGCAICAARAFTATSSRLRSFPGELRTA